MKAAFSVEEEGFDEDGETESENLLQDFIDHIKVHLSIQFCLFKYAYERQCYRIVFLGKESCDAGKSS